MKNKTILAGIMGLMCVSFATTAQADDDVTIHIRGRLQIDAAQYDEANTSNYFSNGTNFRRARLGVYGDVASDFSYQILVDFADIDNIKLDDSFIQYRGVEGWKFTVGQHKVYHSLSSATSDIYVPFMERSFVSGFFEAGAGGKLGISAFTNGENWTFHMGVMGDKVAKPAQDPGGWGLNTRATWAPVMEAGRVIHLGVSSYYRQEADKSIQFSDKPEIRIDGVKLVESGNIKANHYVVSGAEFASVMGRVTLQAEYNRADIDFINGNGQPFWGAHASATYFITGEKNNYKAASGAFGRVSPKRSVSDGGIGAIALSARYGYLDYLYYDGISGQFVDRSTGSTTIGVDWIPVDHIRIQANYVHYNAKTAAGKTGNVFGLRFQADW